jgi:hypothetical protein
MPHPTIAFLSPSRIPRQKVEEQLVQKQHNAVTRKLPQQWLR